ncbi:hypothetical protein HDU93_003334 [Gonapodya sp. JEL0774]|nr:hypothetical protein HDU93_003334 [Gonapodya sp. JEL0774]
MIVEMPSCNSLQSVYRTVRVANEGDNSVKVLFLTGSQDKDREQGPPIFDIKPASCLLKHGDAQLVVVKFSPRESQSYREVIKCTFNNAMVTEDVRALNQHFS